MATLVTLAKFEREDEDAKRTIRKLDAMNATPWHTRSGVYRRKQPDVRDAAMGSEEREVA